MFRSLLPHNANFFDFFEQHIALDIECCREMLALTDDGPSMPVHVARIKDLERRADDVTHQCIDELHKTFITPIDRADILHLIKRLDDIADAVNAVALRMSLYEITTIKPEAREVADILVRSALEIEKALKLMRNMANAPQILQLCIGIYQLENDGDAVLRSALAKLFKGEPNAIEVIKWKEIFEILEKAVDRCEDCANIIQGVVIEGS